MKANLVSILFFLTLNNVLALKVNESELVLNGQGIRKATWFKVKVYKANLYLKEKTSDVQKILNMDYPKYLQMDFVYSVDREKLIGGWNEGFLAAHNTKISPELKKFNALMSNIKKGESIKIRFLSQGVEVSLKGAPFKMIKGESFAKELLAIWFINPRDEGLAKGLRGL